jgi:cysteine desulfurase
VIYLDHNATTPVADEVVDAMLPYLREHWGNPSSSHGPGRAARKGLRIARGHVARLLGCEPEHVLFTSGGTESDNLALRGVSAAREGRVVISAFEHPAVEQPARRLEELGVSVERLAVGLDGRVEVPSALPDDTALLSVMLAHNETGALQPVAELAARARAVGAVVHTDAAQAVGKVPIDVDALNVDLLTVAGHKLYAPKGVGALYVRPGTPIRPLLRGAGHEGGLRPGTENVPYIVGLGEACRLASQRLADDATRLQQLRERLFERLRTDVPELRRTITGPCLPNTLHVRFPGVVGNDLLARCPELAASTGSACDAGVSKPSASLLAMGLSPDDALGALRLSLGRHTTQAQVDQAARWLVDAWEALRAG